MTLQSPELKKKNHKLNRGRGLGWEDELTSELNKSRFMYCYNLGGSTHNIPDIVVFADNYHPAPNIEVQLTIDGDKKAKVNEKLITGPFVMSIECKYTIDDKIMIPKDQVDKCFEFLSQLSKYERYVLLAFKFKNGTKPIKHFTLIKYDPLYVNSDYDFFLMDRGGLCGFYLKGSFHPQKPPTRHQFLNSAHFSITNTRVLHGEFDLDSA